MLKKLAVIFALVVLAGITSCSTVTVSPTTFPVTVDYLPQSPLEKMIADGKYDLINSEITEEHFPRPRIEFNGPAGLPAAVEIKLELVYFKRAMMSEWVLAEFKWRGLRPATLPELLAFGATYPEKQREFPIIALGSVWRDWSGLRGVSYLGGDSGGRRLSLSYFGGRWRDDFRFLAVRF